MIDLEKPLQQAWARTRAHLFTPFDFAAWLRLGLVAWLSTFFNGGPSGISFLLDRIPVPRGSMSATVDRAVDFIRQIGPLGVCGGLLVIGVALIAILWLGCRGQFMLLENVRTRSSSVRGSWQRTRQLANSFFKTYIWIASVPGVMGLLALLVALIEFFSDLLRLQWPTWSELTPWIILGALWVPFAIVWGIGMFFYREFGIPIMIAADCPATDAIWRLWDVLRDKPLDAVIYALVRLVMGALVSVVTILIGCGTCSFGALPYVGAALILPVFIFRQSFILDCLAELAPEYSLWPKNPPPLNDSPAV